MLSRIAVASAGLALTATLLAQSPAPGQQPARDTPAQQQQQAAAPAPSARIVGRVLAADTGRPVRRARVLVRADSGGGRAVLTDDNGVFDFTALAAGRYTVSVQKTGYIALEYGQRRPLQPGTPLTLGDGQELRGIEFRLPPGGVITGHVLDEGGEPVVGGLVRVLRYRYVQGERQLTPAGTAQTDDRGEYRVWGLDPGEYYVNAVTRLLDLGIGRAGGPGPGPGRRGGAFPGGRGGRGGVPGGLAGAAAALGGANAAALFDEAAGDQVNYAPTYYPGVTAVGDAQPLTLGVSQQLESVDFNLLLVATARVSGRVMNVGGAAATSGSVSLTPEEGGGGRGRRGLGGTYGSRIDWDGTFDMANIPPGRYTLRASSDDTGVNAYAAVPMAIAGEDVRDLVVLLEPGATVSGTVRLDGSTTAATSDFSRMRLTAVAYDQGGFPRQPTARVAADGTFTIEGVPAGQHLIRDSGGLRGFELASVSINGRDITDAPLALRSGETVKDVTVVFTNRLTDVTGHLTDTAGNPLTEFTVLAFPVDAALWRPNARQIRTARPDQTGAYDIRGLPPGDYYVAPIDPSVDGEWFEPSFLDAHRAGAARVLLGEGDSKAQDFSIAVR